MGAPPETIALSGAATAGADGESGEHAARRLDHYMARASSSERCTRRAARRRSRAAWGGRVALRGHQLLRRERPFDPHLGIVVLEAPLELVPVVGRLLVEDVREIADTQKPCANPIGQYTIRRSRRSARRLPLAIAGGAAAEVHDHVHDLAPPQRTSFDVPSPTWKCMPLTIPCRSGSGCPGPSPRDAQLREFSRRKVSAKNPRSSPNTFGCVADASIFVGAARMASPYLTGGAVRPPKESAETTCDRPAAGEIRTGRRRRRPPRRARAVHLCVRGRRNVALARLLTPRDFGIFALGMAWCSPGPCLPREASAARYQERGSAAARELRPSRPTARRDRRWQPQRESRRSRSAGRRADRPHGAFAPDRDPEGADDARAGAAARLSVIATAELIEAFVFYGVAIARSRPGSGVWGLALAVVLRAAAGSATLLLAGPLGPVAPRWSWPDIRRCSDSA